MVFKAKVWFELAPCGALGTWKSLSTVQMMWRGVASPQKVQFLSHYRIDFGTIFPSFLALQHAILQKQVLERICTKSPFRKIFNCHFQFVLISTKQYLVVNLLQFFNTLYWSRWDNRCFLLCSTNEQNIDFLGEYLQRLDCNH